MLEQFVAPQSFDVMSLPKNAASTFRYVRYFIFFKDFLDFNVFLRDTIPFRKQGSHWVLGKKNMTTDQMDDELRTRMKDKPMFVVAFRDSKGLTVKVTDSAYLALSNFGYMREGENPFAAFPPSLGVNDINAFVHSESMTQSRDFDY